MKRKTLTTKDKLTILIKQSRCTKCGEKLGELSNVQFDHIHPLALGGEDNTDNLTALHIDCHKLKTDGMKHNRRGADKNNIARVKRINKKHEDFRNRILKTEKEKSEKKSSWKSQKFKTKKKTPVKMM